MQIFRSENRKFRVGEPIAWDGITFLFLNVGSWYFGKMKFNNIVAYWSENFSKTHTGQHRKSGSKTARTWILRASIVEQSPSLMQLLYGVTTLRVMSFPKGDASAQRAAPGRAGKIYRSARNDMSKQNFRFLSFSENADFSIRKSKISSHGTHCLGRYNFFVSQRQKLILSQNEIQKYCCIMISKLF